MRWKDAGAGPRPGPSPRPGRPARPQRLSGSNFDVDKGFARNCLAAVIAGLVPAIQESAATEMPMGHRVKPDDGGLSTVMQ